MADAELIRNKKRRSSKSVLSGVSLIAVSLFFSAIHVAPEVATTLGAIVGFLMIMYGVCLGWMVFYERESDGPSA